MIGENTYSGGAAVLRLTSINAASIRFSYHAWRLLSSAQSALRQLSINCAWQMEIPENPEAIWIHDWE
jgi:hypothetical protein